MSKNLEKAGRSGSYKAGRLSAQNVCNLMASLLPDVPASWYPSKLNS